MLYKSTCCPCCGLFSFLFALQQLFSPGLVAWGPLLRGSPEPSPSRTEFVLFKSLQVLLNLALVNKMPLQAVAVNTQHLTWDSILRLTHSPALGSSAQAAWLFHVFSPTMVSRGCQPCKMCFTLLLRLVEKTSGRLLKLSEGCWQEASCCFGEPESLTSAIHLESY